MRRVLALALVLAVVYGVRVLGDGPELRATGLAFGGVLIAAALAGALVERLHLPRVTGYLLFGMLCGPFFANIISSTMARELRLVNGLAVALIAFIAGLEMNLAHLRPRLGRMLRLGGTTIAVTNLGFFLLFWLTWEWLPIYPGASGLTRVSLAMLFASLATCSSPSVAIGIIAESRAAGLLSELVVTVVILGDLVLILLFTLAMEFVQAALGGTVGEEVGLAVRLSWQIFGSMAFGAVLGAVFAVYVRHVGREIALVLLALCAVLSEVGHLLQFEPVLSALAAGLVVENIAPPGVRLKEALERGALPVLVIFFATAGASLDLGALSRVGLVAAAISVARLGLYRFGSRLGARLASIHEQAGGLVWMGLVSQAGVTLGLSTIVASEYPGWGVRLQTLVLALIAIHQLIGPVLFRAALARSGEIGKMRPLGSHA